MILPILIVESDVKKILTNLFDPAKQQSLMRWLDKFIDTFTWRSPYLSLDAAMPAQGIYLPQLAQLNSYKQILDKYCYVLACYKPKNQELFQQMSLEDKQQLLQQIKSDYSQILINYFTTDKKLKEKIDKFINAIFYANIPVPQIIEIHMELIDEFSKQLKLEGRSDETLLDYRLTLIDVLANLCEVYRCSISK
ncbi:MAG: circadian clock protein KaiA [Desmonostoc vinosum HA7617-LM4]|jgi:circadian clock protein KaiA|nr:circadian clock protein KaiA [Desmonostoc vinosum HA7617-LM4]